MKISEDSVTGRTREVARDLYVAYTANSENLNFRGEQCPAWSDLTPEVRSHWCAVALAAVSSVFGIVTRVIGVDA